LARLDENRKGMSMNYDEYVRKGIFQYEAFARTGGLRSLESTRILAGVERH